MKNTLETKLGIFVFLAVVAGWAIVETIGGVEWFRPGYHVSALFNTVQDLKPGDRVKMAGVEIGRVEDIQLTTNKVMVTMKLRDQAVVKTDSKATVKFTGLMGQNFVDIDFGSPGGARAKDGTVLETEEQKDLSAVMNKLSDAVDGIQNMTQAFSKDDIKQVVAMFGSLQQVITENREKVAAVLTDVTNISHQVSSGQGTVGKLIYDDTLYTTALTTVSNLDNTGTSANDLIASVKLVVTNLSAGKGTLGKLLTDDTLHRQLVEGMTNVDEILYKINKTTNNTIAKLVNQPEMYNNLKLTMQKFDKAADSLEDQGPLSVISILAGPLGL